MELRSKINEPSQFGLCNAKDKREIIAKNGVIYEIKCKECFTVNKREKL